MKYAPFFSLLANLLLLLAAGAGRATACGPYTHIIPTPHFFAIDPSDPAPDPDKAENLRLWQKLTSARIPLCDIEKAVYKDSSNDVIDALLVTDSGKSDNLFYTFIKNTNDIEVAHFLHLAKRIEECRSKQLSPWYYPRKRDIFCDDSYFDNLIEECLQYGGTRLRDRYGLQCVRAMFSNHDYARCVTYYDSVFAPIADDNLFKRMATRYVAGSLCRLDEVDRANELFASVGDVRSIICENPAEYMARNHPTAPQLLEYVRREATDSARMARFVPLAESLIRDRRVSHKADWEYLLAFFYGEYAADSRQSAKYLGHALSHSFADGELRDMARAYYMKSELYPLDSPSMLSDLKRLEAKCDIFSPDCHEWVRRLQNIIYSKWVPRLWEAKDYARAVMLCAYADYVEQPNRRIAAVQTWAFTQSVPLDYIRNDSGYYNGTDYSTLSFQMMGSLTSDALERVYRAMMQDEPLAKFVRRKIRTDADFYNELIGTLALREENYDRAIAFLATVSRDYQRCMNIYDKEYLCRDPFTAYPSRWDSNGVFESQSSSASDYTAPLDDAKLNFARRMKKYSRDKAHAPTADLRGMARLMYAIGRRNALEECWALTQYWRGGGVGLFDPILYYSPFGEDDFYERHYSFLYDYHTTVGHARTEEIYQTEVAAALAMMQSPDVRAEAEYILGNLATVIRHYPSTPTASHIRTSCDNWQSWL